MSGSDDPYTQGCEAYTREAGLFDNPYCVDSIQYKSWAEGWIDQQTIEEEGV